MGSPTRMLASVGQDSLTTGSRSRRAWRSRGRFAVAVLVVAAGLGVALLYSIGLPVDAPVRSTSATTHPGAMAAQVARAHPAVALPGSTMANGAAPAPLLAESSSDAGTAPPVSVAATVVAASTPAFSSASIETASISIQGPAPAMSTATVANSGTAGALPPVANALDKLALESAEAAPMQRLPASHTAGHARKSRSKEVNAKPPRAGGAGGVVRAKAGTGGVETASARRARKGDDDADTELVAAIIARLDRRGALPSQPTMAGASKQDDPATADMLHKCEAMSDPLDARRCRNKVCEKHWGKTDACPASRAPGSSTGAGADQGKPG